MSSITPSSDSAYQDFLQAIKSQVVQSRVGAARAVNRSLIEFYWAFGQLIVERQETLGWGKAVVERLSADLKQEFPEIKGFSPQNLWLIRQFYTEYQQTPNLQQLVGEIPWGHNILIMQRIKAEKSLKSFSRPDNKLSIVEYMGVLNRVFTVPVLVYNL